jgi:hypothetical protein
MGRNWWFERDWSPEALERMYFRRISSEIKSKLKMSI